MGPDSSQAIQILLVWCPAGSASQERTLALPPGACLADALAAAGGFAPTTPAPAGWARWGKILQPADVLCHGDEIAAVWPLRADPKVARRLRVAKQRQARRASGKKTCWLPA